MRYSIALDMQVETDRLKRVMEDLWELFDYYSVSVDSFNVLDMTGEVAEALDRAHNDGVRAE